MQVFTFSNFLITSFIDSVSINMLWTLTAFPVLLVIYDKRFKNSSSKCCAASDDFQYTTEEPTKEEDNKSDRCENGKLRGSAVARAYFKTISKHTNLRLCGREFKILYVAMMLVCCSLATGAFMCSQALLLQTPSGQGKQLTSKNTCKGENLFIT